MNNDKQYDNSKNDFIEDKINLPVLKISEIDELREKWNFENLQKRFMERINTHIKCNDDTKNQLKSYVQKLNNKAL